MVFGHPAKENAYANKLEAQAKEYIPGRALPLAVADILCPTPYGKGVYPRHSDDVAFRIF